MTTETQQKQNTTLIWQDGVPFSARFGDPYFSRSDGLAESRHVFLAGNGLPARFRDGFHIAELGFGTGLNLLAAWSAWRASGQRGPLTYTSFELAPLSPAEMARAHGAWPELAALSGEFLRLAEGRPVPDLALQVIRGDAAETLPRWTGRADAWFLDGFSPARNPDLWSPGLMAGVAGRTAPGGTFATYSAAGHVRRALAAAGFLVEKVPGYGAKKHMTRGRLP